MNMLLPKDGYIGWQFSGNRLMCRLLVEPFESFENSLHFFKFVFSDNLKGAA